MLGGGLERGTTALLIGGAGVGKSSIALSYAVAAAERDEQAVIFAFDEGLATIYARTAGLGLPLKTHVDAGSIRLQQIDPAEMSPGEFASLVRRAVEQHNARVVVIDSLNGYLNAMPEERFLVLQLHELSSYLNQLGVLTIIVLAAAWLDGSDADSLGRQLSQRRRHHAAVFRGRWARAAGDFGGEEAQWPT